MWTISRKGDRENCNDWLILIFCESLWHLLVRGLRNGFEGTSRSLLETTKIRMEGSNKLSTKMSSLQEWITNDFNTKRFKLSTYFSIFFLTIFLIQYKISDTTCSEPPSILQSWWWQVIELHFTKHVSDAKYARQGQNLIFLILWIMKLIGFCYSEKFDPLYSNRT